MRCRLARLAADAVNVWPVVRTEVARVNDFRGGVGDAFELLKRSHRHVEGQRANP